MDIGSQRIMAIVKETMEDPAINRFLEVHEKVKVNTDGRWRSYETRVRHPFPATSHYRGETQEKKSTGKGWNFANIYDDVKVSVLVACSNLNSENADYFNRRGF